MTIDRLPFPRPDDPLLQARRDRAGGRAFSLVDLPRAATLLAQGAGRLIRTAEDRGVVAVLDPRLATASYRGVLLATLPPMRRSVDLDEVEAFLRERWRTTSSSPDPDLAAAQYPRRLSISSRFCQWRLHLHVEVEVGPLGQRRRARRCRPP